MGLNLISAIIIYHVWCGMICRHCWSVTWHVHTNGNVFHHPQISYLVSHTVLIPWSKQYYLPSKSELEKHSSSAPYSCNCISIFWLVDLLYIKTSSISSEQQVSLRLHFKLFPTQERASLTQLLWALIWFPWQRKLFDTMQLTLNVTHYNLSTAEVCTTRVYCGFVIMVSSD